MANEDRLPQFDRAKIKTPIGFFSTLFRLMRISEEFAIPAIVKEYDRNTGIVKVQPLVSNLADDVNNQEVEIPRSEYEVHVVRFAHGGYVVDAPLFVGDTGWLIAGDRNSTSAIKANSTILEEDQTDENSPNEGYKKPDDNSLKSFAWGFFIPDTWGITDFTDEDGLVVRGQRISVESDHVTVKCGENSASISKESVNIDTEKCSIEIKEDYASVISGKYGAKIDGNGAIVQGPNDKISIDDNGLHHKGAIDEKRDIISAIEYDEDIGDLVKKSFSVSKRGDLIVDIDEETDWERLGLPNPPSANDGKLTIKQGNDTLGTFTANQAGDTTVAIPVPPVVNDGTLTIKQGEVVLGTFTANQADNQPVTVVIPNPPTPTTPGDGIITITQGSNTLGTFTVNQVENSTIPIPVVPVLGIIITQEPVAPSPDHPDGGIEIMFQPTQDGQPHGQPTVVTLWNGSGGGGGGTDLSDTPALDVVPSTGQASAGVATTASRQDHVHRMPATVLLSDVVQVISAAKTFSTSSGGLKFATASDNAVTMRGWGSSTGLGIYVGNDDTSGRILTASSAGGVIVIGGPSDGSYPAVRLGSTPSVSPSSMSSTTETRVPTLKWVDDNYQRKLTAGSNITILGNTISATQPTVNNGTLTIKQGTITLGTFSADQSTDTIVTIPTPPKANDGTLTIKQGTTTLGTFSADQSTDTIVTIPTPPTPPSGTVEFVADVDWYVNGSDHQLRKRLRVLDLASGQVTDKAGTTYANGWEVITNTTPISSIIGS